MYPLGRLPYGRSGSLLSSPTIVLILLNVLIFLAMLVSGDVGECNSLVCILLAQENSLVLGGFYWQLFTSMFVHFGPLHLLFNMFGLYYFGRFNEITFTRSEFLTVYFASGLLGNIMTLILLPTATLSGGASGAIFGLLGSYVAMARRGQHLGFAVIYAVIVLVQSSLIPGVNIFAHLFGLIGGLVLGLLFSSSRKPVGYSVEYSYST